MYCQKCGCRVKRTDEKCPNCGSVVSLEYCGGFWGLVGEEPKSRSNSVKRNLQQEDMGKRLFQAEEEKTEAEQKQNEAEKEKEKYRHLLMEKRKVNEKNRKVLKILTAALGVLLIVCVLESAFLLYKNFVQENYRNLSADYEALEENYKILEDKYEALNQKYAKMDKKYLEIRNAVEAYEGLQQGYEKIKQIYEKAMEKTTEYLPNEEQNLVSLQES